MNDCIVKVSTQLRSLRHVDTIELAIHSPLPDVAKSAGTIRHRKKRPLAAVRGGASWQRNSGKQQRCCITRI